MKPIDDAWDSGDPYDYFMGRWSKLMALKFLEWLSLPHNLSWLDVGCGTGALSESIVQNYKPASLCCIDPSTNFLVKAKERLSGNADIMVGSASRIPKDNKTFDVVVSGLALNFFNDLSGALSEMKRVLKANGIIAAYLWDYAGRMEFLRVFWDAVCEVKPDDCNLDEGIRFPICNCDKLNEAFMRAGIADIEISYLDIDTVFRDFADYWNPLLGGQGPAPSYLTFLPEDVKSKIKANIVKRAPVAPDGTIKLLARAIAIRGSV